MIVIPLIGAYVLRTWGELKKGIDKRVMLSYIGFSTILIVDLSGLLMAETTRVWLFLQPLIAIPAGLELKRLDEPQRIVILLLLWLNVVVIKSSMWFILP